MDMIPFRRRSSSSRPKWGMSPRIVWYLPRGTKGSRVGWEGGGWRGRVVGWGEWEEGEVGGHMCAPKEWVSKGVRGDAIGRDGWARDGRAMARTLQS